jgi:PAP2 superfamily
MWVSMNNIDTRPDPPGVSAATARPRSLEPWAEFGRQIGFIAAAVFLYFLVRGQTQGEGAVAIHNGYQVLAFEHRYGLDVEQWAQSLIITRPWRVNLANSIYIWGHWPVIAGTLIWLHQKRRDDYLLLRNAMFISGAVGLVIFATYAVAPPRLLGVGLDDTVTQHSNAYRVLQPPSLVNKYAAIPSLHVGWNLLIGISLYRASASRLLRAVAVVSPILMAGAVVVTANHYVIDGILGSGLALAGLNVSFLITPRLRELDRRLRLRHRGEDSLVIDDQSVDTPTDETLRRVYISYRPAEHQPKSPPELGHPLGAQQPAVHDHSIHRDS